MKIHNLQKVAWYEHRFHFGIRKYGNYSLILALDGRWDDLSTPPWYLKSLGLQEHPDGHTFHRTVWAPPLRLPPLLCWRSTEPTTNYRIKARLTIRGQKRMLLWAIPNTFHQSSSDHGISCRFIWCGPFLSCFCYIHWTSRMWNCAVSQRYSILIIIQSVCFHPKLWWLALHEPDMAQKLLWDSFAVVLSVIYMLYIFVSCISDILSPNWFVCLVWSWSASAASLGWGNCYLFKLSEPFFFTNFMGELQYFSMSAQVLVWVEEVKNTCCLFIYFFKLI